MKSCSAFMFLAAAGPVLLLGIGMRVADAADRPGQLSVRVLGKDFQPPLNVTVSQTAANLGGSTSVRNEPAAELSFKSSGYFQRNRDLGQVFTATADGGVDSLILRTGNSDAAVRSGAAGQELFVQWFEVTGRPVINDNGTSVGDDALHGFSSNHRCDDFISGVTYRSLGVFRGGVFPDLPATSDSQGRSRGDETSKLTYLRFDFPVADRVNLVAGRRYAFLVGFVSPAADAGFTLANVNRAADPAAAPSDPAAESRVGGWGIRREGDGRPKPSLVLPQAPAAGSEIEQRMWAESMLPPGDARFDQPPQTDGYPDVDTYRDLSFHLIQSRLTVSRVAGPPDGPSVRIAQTSRDETGPTSFRYYAPRDGEPTKDNTLAYDPDPNRSDAEINQQSEAFYYYRDRDLGQTITIGDRPIRLGAITVRLQPVDVAGGGDPAGAAVSLQLMRVSGQAVIDDNGTRAGNPRWATYAFSWPDDPDDPVTPDRRSVKHWSDDFIRGESYEHLMVARGGVVPDDLATNDYLRWELGGASVVELAAGTTYAFLFLFDEPAAPGVNRNIPLSNRNVLPTGSGVDPFPGGHMIRREGSSTVFDDVFIADRNDPDDVEAARQAAMFPTDFDRRLQQQPGTLGYPDVDTYRDLYFVLEEAP